MSQESKKGGKRGFASMSPVKIREIASMGGKSVPPGKRFFAQNRDAARDAGRLGGLATPAAKRVFSIDRQCAVRAARKAARARV